MVWHGPGDKPLSEPMMFSLLTHICVTRPQWVRTCTCDHLPYVTNSSWVTSFSCTEVILVRFNIDFTFLERFCVIDVMYESWSYYIGTRHRFPITLQTLNSTYTGIYSTHWLLGDGAAMFKLLSRINILRISCEIALRWMPLDLIDEESTLVQVMARCCQAASHYLSQCCPRSVLQFGITRP